MPRMTNTYMLGGTQTRDEIVAGLSAPLRHQLRRRPSRHHERQVRVLGERGVLGRERQDPYPVKGATLIGSGPDALTRVSA
jgi:TldD protein